jgi:hypothetical protein
MVPPISVVMIEEIIRHLLIEPAPLVPNAEKTALITFGPRFHTRRRGGLVGETCWGTTCLPSIKKGLQWTSQSERLVHMVELARPTSPKACSMMTLSSGEKTVGSGELGRDIPTAPDS